MRKMGNVMEAQSIDLAATPLIFSISSTTSVLYFPLALLLNLDPESNLCYSASLL